MLGIRRTVPVRSLFDFSIDQTKTFLIKHTYKHYTYAISSEGAIAMNGSSNVAIFFSVRVAIALLLLSLVVIEERTGILQQQRKRNYGVPTMSQHNARGCNKNMTASQQECQ
jgi:hypothetical protein